MDNELQAEIAKKFLTPEKFAVAIEKIVKENRINYIDAIVMYCEINTIEIDTIPKLISKPLKEKLKRDAIELNFMKKTTRAKLPL
jgi:ATP-dependent Clp protease ATP-binding subunit ClpA